jgi:molecular chaperone GrpE
MDEKNEVQNNDTEEIIETLDEDGAQPRLRKLHDELKQCESERKEYLDGWQRAKADHVNYRNDEGKRFEDMARFVTTGLIQDILPVLDSFAALENIFKGEPRPSEDGRDLALGHGLPKEVERGVLLIRSQFEDILKKRGLAEINVQAGETFNPEVHESTGETESDQPPGSVAEVIQKGYTLGEKVLRPARVTLAKQKDRPMKDD